MPIPALDAHGLLPVGVHDCTWQEIEDQFCWNAQRSTLFQQLQNFLTAVWQPMGIQAPLWVDGSFTRKKDSPQDVDVVADVAHLDQQAAWPVAMLWMQRHHIKANYNVDFWFKHPMYPADLTAFFCYTGLKAGAELGLDAKHPKGILRVNP